MARTKRGVVSRAKHNKVLKSVKGQRGRRKNTIRIARQAMEKAMQYAYRDRKAKKREFRSLWIQRINNLYKVILSILFGLNDHYHLSTFEFWVSLYFSNVFSVFDNSLH